MLLQNLRAKIGARLDGTSSESGFTLIELLVVMLILGILAAIALPAFFNQKDKAGDAKAKEYAHSAQVAMETYATDNSGSYAGATVTGLVAIEPTLSSADIEIPAAGLGEDEYEIVSTSDTDNTFSVVNTQGTLEFPCTVPTGSDSRGGCPGTGDDPGDWGGE
jgi:type IV pilus assembly protein PilA